MCCVLFKKTYRVALDCEEWKIHFLAQCRCKVVNAEHTCLTPGKNTFAAVFASFHTVTIITLQISLRLTYMVAYKKQNNI